MSTTCFAMFFGWLDLLEVQNFFPEDSKSPHQSVPSYISLRSVIDIKLNWLCTSELAINSFSRSVAKVSLFRTFPLHYFRERYVQNISKSIRGLPIAPFIFSRFKGSFFNFPSSLILPCLPLCRFRAFRQRLSAIFHPSMRPCSQYTAHSATQSRSLPLKNFHATDSSSVLSSIVEQSWYVLIPFLFLSVSFLTHFAL